MVGAAGFEPTASAPPVQRATRLRHAPIVDFTLLKKGFFGKSSLNEIGWRLSQTLRVISCKIEPMTKNA
jgi:hypothetical protein